MPPSACGVLRQTLHRILAEKNAITPEMALRRSRLFGSNPDFWLRMQAAHDLWHAQRKIAGELRTIKRVREAA